MKVYFESKPTSQFVLTIALLDDSAKVIKRPRTVPYSLGRDSTTLLGCKPNRIDGKPRMSGWKRRDQFEMRYVEVHCPYFSHRGM